MAQVLDKAPVQAKLDLIRAHPELAGKAMETNTLTAESTNEQNKAGLTRCTPEELEHIRKLNAEYGKRFGFPSSWPCAVRAARAWPRPRSSRPSSAACTTTPTSSWARRCATSTALPKSA